MCNTNRLDRHSNVYSIHLYLNVSTRRILLSRIRTCMLAGLFRLLFRNAEFKLGQLYIKRFSVPTHLWGSMCRYEKIRMNTHHIAPWRHSLSCCLVTTRCILLNWNKLTIDHVLRAWCSRNQPDSRYHLGIEHHTLSLRVRSQDHWDIQCSRSTSSEISVTMWKMDSGLVLKTQGRKQTLSARRDS